MSGCWFDSLESDGGVEITPFVVVEKQAIIMRLLIGLLASLFGQQNAVDVGQYTASGDGDAAKQLAQLLVIAHGQLYVAGYNAGLLVVTSGVTGQLQNLSCEVLQNGSLRPQSLKDKCIRSNSCSRLICKGLQMRGDTRDALFAAR